VSAASARQATTAGLEEGLVAELQLGQVVMAVDRLVVERTRRAGRRAEAVGALVAVLIAEDVKPPELVSGSVHDSETLVQDGADLQLNPAYGRAQTRYDGRPEANEQEGRPSGRCATTAGLRVALARASSIAPVPAPRPRTRWRRMPGPAAPACPGPAAAAAGGRRGPVTRRVPRRNAPSLLRGCRLGSPGARPTVPRAARRPCQARRAGPA
jgi:hypothetical protein